MSRLKPPCTCRVSIRECPRHPSAFAKAIRKVVKWNA